MGTQTGEPVSKEISHVEFSVLDENVLAVRGKDDKGTPWKAEIPYKSGLGWTSVWTGDFDQNGRDDFLIVSSFPENGRCPSHARVTFLMQDPEGRPVPWSIDIRLDSKGSFQDLPIAVADDRVAVYGSPKGTDVSMIWATCPVGIH